MTYDILTNILTLLFGGGIGWLINWRANKRKANGEAAQTEAEAMKSVQDVYQQALADQQTYIDKLKETRDRLIDRSAEVLKENEELRKRMNAMDGKLSQLQEEVSRNRQLASAMRVWLCGRVGCTKRIQADFGSSSDSSED